MAECLCLKNVTFYEQSDLLHQNDTHDNLFCDWFDFNKTLLLIGLNEL